MSTDESVRYIDKSREYYAAQGYDEPYRWAQHDDIPFVRPSKPLADCTATIVTTAMPDDSYRDRGRRLAMGELSSPPDGFDTGDLFWDRDATHTRDRETYFPVRALERAIAAGRLGGLAPRYFCIPTLYSTRRTIEQDAPAIVAACVEDAVDVALLVPL
ncbi:MAG: hypothetical protein ACU85V_14250 [Gammaproteobacteria bacterium]